MRKGPPSGGPFRAISPVADSIFRAYDARLASFASTSRKPRRPDVEGRNYMRYRSRRVGIVAAVLLVLLAAALAAVKVHGHATPNRIALKQLAFENAGADNPASESNDYLTAAQQ